MKELVDMQIPKLNAIELIKQDESYNLEFKSTFSYNINEGKADKTLKFEVIKTLVAFMNSHGGTLLIGVSDDHKIIGMELDYQSNWKGNKNGFLMDFRNSVESIISMINYNKYISLDFETINDKEICIVKVEKSLDPIFIKRDNKKYLYVRSDNKTEPLDDPEEINLYIEDNWK